jgi:hypothetical protein
MKIEVWKVPATPLSTNLAYHACVPGHYDKLPEGAVLLHTVEGDSWEACAGQVDQVVKADAEGALEALRTNLGIDEPAEFFYQDVSHVVLGGEE